MKIEIERDLQSLYKYIHQEMLINEALKKLNKQIKNKEIEK